MRRAPTCWACLPRTPCGAAVCLAAVVGLALLLWGSEPEAPRPKPLAWFQRPLREHFPHLGALLDVDTEDIAACTPWAAGDAHAPGAANGTAGDEASGYQQWQFSVHILDPNTLVEPAARCNISSPQVGGRGRAARLPAAWQQQQQRARQRGPSGPPLCSAAAGL